MIFPGEDRHEHTIPELLLWGAVLRQAVRDAVKGEAGAREWLVTDNVEALCIPLGLDPSHFRVRAWTLVARHALRREMAKRSEAQHSLLALRLADNAKATAELALARCASLRAS